MTTDDKPHDLLYFLISSMSVSIVNQRLNVSNVRAYQTPCGAKNLSSHYRKWARDKLLHLAYGEQRSGFSGSARAGEDDM